MSLQEKIADAKARLNRTPPAAYDLYITRFQEYRRLVEMAA